MTAGERRRGQGFSYLMLLWWVAIGSATLAALAQSWALQARREREAELVFRGEQMAAAIASYRAATPSGQPHGLRRLEDLLDDRRQVRLKRHLRQLWPDPITLEAWGLVREGEDIVGVHSLSTRVPLSAPQGVNRYDQWHFSAASVPAAASGASTAQTPSNL